MIAEIFFPVSQSKVSMSGEKTKSQRFSDFSIGKNENLKSDSKVSVVFPTSLVSHELCLVPSPINTLNHNIIFV